MYLYVSMLHVKLLIKLAIGSYSDTSCIDISTQPYHLVTNN